MAPPQKHILILGCGITGLTTALSFLTSPSLSTSTSTEFKITILASHIPGDLSPHYTSPWAGGHWRSHATLSDAEAEVRKWDARTYEYWTELLENGDGEIEGEGMKEREIRLGLGFRGCRYFWGEEGEETRGGDGRGIWFRNIVKGFEILDLKEEEGVPDGAVMGMKYRSICFDPPRYLCYLFSRIKDLGAVIIKADVDTNSGLAGIIQHAKKILASNRENHEIFALVNCTGLSARHFLPQSEELFPIRGQTIILKGSTTLTQTYISIPSIPSSEILYVVPRPGSNTTILGGCKQPGNWEESIDEEFNAKILNRVKEAGFCKEMGELEVLGCQVGFRPGRKGGPRCEVEGTGRIEGVWVVHCYGHGGGGYQGSVGCGERVVELVLGLEDRRDET